MSGSGSLSATRYDGNIRVKIKINAANLNQRVRAKKYPVIKKSRALKGVLPAVICSMPTAMKANSRNAAVVVERL